MSSWSKGAKNEKLYCQLLEKQGFKTYRNQKQKFSVQDMFGCDIIAIGNKKVLFIQVKSNKKRMPAFLKKTKKILQDLAKSLLNTQCEVYWVGYHQNKKHWKQVLV